MAERKTGIPAPSLGLAFPWYAGLPLAPDAFIIPAMLGILAVLTLLRRPLEKGDAKQ